MTDLSTDTATLLRRLARLVVKNGVGVGLLADDDRTLALAAVWAALPAEVVLSERQINEQLKAQLAGPAAWLDTDHVELRRWLVDAGFVQRDGYGREYRQVPDAYTRHPALARALQGVDTTAFALAQRSAHAAARAERRQRWQAQPA
jgi:hypothetical protein